MTPEPGRFISLEGIDGSGKSTQARRLAEALRARGHEVVLTREPGGSEGAEAIRALLLTGEAARWSARTEVLLFTAARSDHLERTIEPALARGATVICDRFADSTRVYQGAARSQDPRPSAPPARRERAVLRGAMSGTAGTAEGGVAMATGGRALVDAIHAAAIGREPDLTLILDMDPRAALARSLRRLASGEAARAAGSAAWAADLAPGGDAEDAAASTAEVVAVAAHASSLSRAGEGIDARRHARGPLRDLRAPVPGPPARGLSSRSPPSSPDAAA